MSKSLPTDPSAEPAMARKTVKERKKEVLKKLLETKEKVVLYGKHGVGKTWMAKELSDLAVSSFDITIWVFLNREYEEMALYENIVWQLSLFPATEEVGFDGEDTELNGEGKRKQEGAGKEGKDKEKEERLKKLKQAMTLLTKKKCLLILDGGDKEKEDQVLQYLQFSSTILATRRERGDASGGYIYFKVEPLGREDSISLLKERAKVTISDQLGEAIWVKSGGLPAAVIAIIESLNHMVNYGSGFWTPECAFEEVTSHMGEATFEEADEKLMELLCYGYDKSANDNVVSKCCWHSIEFFREHGEVHYLELITYWIMEGYFDPIDHLEEAYKKGHRVLMLFIDSGFLKQKEGKVMAMEGADLMKLTDHRRLGFDGEASLGLSNVGTTSIGRVIQTEGTIKTYLGTRKSGKAPTLLADGTRLCREVTHTFFRNMQELHILALFNPRFQSLPVSVFETDKLLVLAFRGSGLLEKIYHLQKLKSLVILEISGARHLNRIPDDLFENMVGLQCLNLSLSQITSLPPSLSKLTELRWLVLRGCSRLVTLESLGKFVKLEVLVLSGCSSFKRFSDRIFPPLLKFRILDLSYTPIQRLPFFHKLKSFKRLILRGCESLHIIPRLESLSALQVLDAHGAVNLKQLMDESFANQKDLQILDLSKTSVSQLPANIGNISELYLSSCSQLSKLPSSQAMTKLKILDLSDASMLADIEGDFFDHLSRLGQLLLSKAIVKTLPSLSSLKNLHHLSIKGCKELKELPSVKALSKLELLDISGCCELKLVQDESFESMTRLQTLDLSETKVEHLPRLPNPSNLSHLLLRDCKELKELASVRALGKLEVLDVSGCSELKLVQDESFENMQCLQKLDLSETKVEHLPPLPSSLCHLLLRNCTKLTRLPKLESQTKLEELDLCAASSLKDFNADFLKHMGHLQILNLSQTPLLQLPSMADLKKLRELVLSHCSGLQDVPELPDSLEVLDLSGTGVNSLPSLSTLPKLQKLFLTDCQEMDFSSVESTSQLQVLSLYGTGTKGFPYKVTESAHLKRLDLPNSQAMGQVDWARVKYLPEELNWEQCGLIKPAETDAESSQVPNFSEKNTFLQEIYFKQFNIYFHGDEQGMEEIYSLVKHIPHPQKQGEFVEIQGSYSFPDSLKSTLMQAESISLVDLVDISPLSKLGAGTVEAMKRCCLEGCLKMKSIVSGEEMDAELGEKIETLWVSNLPQLRTICIEKLQNHVGFKKLQHLYLDCCPRLRYVFSSSQVPPNLETLQVKFCDQLEMIIKHGEDSCTLPNLKTLYLLELPELKRIGCALPKSSEIRECPQLRHEYFC